MVDYATARMNMVESQLRTNKVTDIAIIEAFERIPRESFVPESVRSVAYVDDDLPVGEGRKILEPMVLARLLQAAEVQPSDVVLDVGCATGYATAVLAGMVTTVVALDSDEALAAAAEATLHDLGVDNALVVRGDLRDGYAKQAPYDVILVNGAAAEVPQALLDQLADGGRLVAVKLDDGGVGRATLMRRDGSVVSSRTLFDANAAVLPGFEKKAGFTF